MSILDIFRSQPAPAAAPVQVPAGNIQDPATVAAQSQVAVSAESAAPGSASLDQFKDLWAKAPVDPNAPPAPANTLGLTQEAVQAIVAKTDFSKVVTPETMAAIAAGGEGAQAALAAALNQVAQHTMTQSTIVNNKLTEKYVQEQIKAAVDQLPSAMRSQDTANQLKAANPLFSNPAVAPIMEAARDQLLVKYPNDTPAQITEKAQAYVMAMAQSINPAAPKLEAGDDGQDWSKFLELNS